MAQRESLTSALAFTSNFGNRLRLGLYCLCDKRAHELCKLHFGLHESIYPSDKLLCAVGIEKQVSLIQNPGGLPMQDGIGYLHETSCKWCCKAVINTCLRPEKVVFVAVATLTSSRCFRSQFSLLLF